MQHRLYIVIDESLDPIYGCVQGGHAVAQYMLDNQDSLWKNDYLIYVKGDVEQIVNKLEHRSIPHSQFREPDLDNKLTAIALYGNNNIVSKLKLV